MRSIATMAANRLPGIGYYEWARTGSHGKLGIARTLT